MTKKEKLKELIKKSWLSSFDEKEIYEAFGYEVDEVSYLHIRDSGGDFVCISTEKDISEIIEDRDIDDLDDDEIDEIYEKLKYDYSLDDDIE